MHGLGFPLLALLLGSGASGVLAADRFVIDDGERRGQRLLEQPKPLRHRWGWPRAGDKR